MMANEWSTIRSFSFVEGMTQLECRSTSEKFGLSCGGFDGYGDERWRKRKRR